MYVYAHTHTTVHNSVTPWSRFLLESQHLFTYPEISAFYNNEIPRCSQQSASIPYRETTETNSKPSDPIYWSLLQVILILSTFSNTMIRKPVLILSSYICIHLTSVIFPSGSSTKTLYFSCPMRATYPGLHHPRLDHLDHITISYPSRNFPNLQNFHFSTDFPKTSRYSKFRYLKINRTDARSGSG